VCYSSNKWGRTAANRKLRRAVKARIHLDYDEDDYIPKVLREVSNTYSFPSDGLPWYNEKNTLDGYYHDLLQDVGECLTVGFEVVHYKTAREYIRLHNGHFTGYVEDMCHYFHRPITAHTLRGFENREYKEFARVLWKKRWGR
jgi:hypothetical protein